MTGKGKRGRSAWEPDLERIEELAANGLTQEQIAHACGIGVSTLHFKKADDPDLVAAISRGQARGIAQVANKLFQAAMKGNVVAAIFYLKARAGWREADAVAAQQVPVAALVVPGAMTAEEWAGIYQKYRAESEARATIQ